MDPVLGGLVRIVRVIGDADLRALWRFRHVVFVEQLGWLDPEASGEMRDVYDDVALNYAALDESGDVIGSVRVVPDTPLGLPLERYAPLDGYRSGRSVGEVSRLAVHSERATLLLAMRLMKAAFECAEALSITDVVMDTSIGGKTIRLYERMGFSRVGAPFTDTFHLGAMTCVMLAQPVADVRADWPATHPSLHRFFVTHDPDIVHEPTSGAE